MQLKSGVAVAVAQATAAVAIQPLAWELPYATGSALKELKKKKKERERESERKRVFSPRRS